MRRLIHIPLLLLALQIFGQADVGTEDIVIEKDFKAIIQDAERIEFPPDFNDTASLDFDYSYRPSERNYALSFEPGTVKPLALRREKRERFRNSFIKLGFGHPRMPYGEISYHETSLDKMRFGGYYRHMSASDNKNRAFQQYADNDAGGYFSYYTKKAAIDLNFDFDHRRDFHYGFWREGISLTKDSVSRKVKVYDATVAVHNHKPSKKGFDYRLQTGYRRMTENSPFQEHELHALLDLEKRFQKVHHLGFRTDVNVIQLDRDSTINRQILQFMPYYRFYNADWKLEGAIQLAYDAGKVRLFGDAGIQKKLAGNFLIFYGRWRSRLQINTYRSFLLENPHLQNDIPVLNSRIEDRLAGLKGSIRQFTWNLQLGQQLMRNLPLYVNDPTDAKRFVLAYDTVVRVFHAHADLGFNVRKTVFFQLGVDYREYDPKNNDEAWHLPELTGSLLVRYRYRQKLQVGMEAYLVNGAWALRPDGSQAFLGSRFDLNLSASYQINDLLGVFLNLNNLANNKQEIWYNYPQFGVNVLGGVSVRF